MSEVELYIQLCQRELHGCLPQLFAHVRDFHKLVSENYNLHAARISEILLWIATNHPKVLEGDSKLLSPYSVTNLCFRSSYEKLDNLIPSEALTTLLKSRICSRVGTFCGYIDPRVLNMDSLKNVETLKLAVGKDNINLFSQISSLMDGLHSFHDIDIHLLCGELNQDDLASFPILTAYQDRTICISDVSDQDVAWVLQTALAVNRQKTDCLLQLKRSKLTAPGFESIVMGLPELKIGHEWSLGVSSPHISQPEVVIADDVQYEVLYFERISHKYNISCFSFTDNEYEQEFLCENLDIDYSFTE